MSQKCIILIMPMGKDTLELQREAEKFFSGTKVKPVSENPFTSAGALEGYIETTQQVADVYVVGTKKLTNSIDRAVKNGKTFFLGKLENGKLEFVRTTTMREASNFN